VASLLDVPARIALVACATAISCAAGRLGEHRADELHGAGKATHGVEHAWIVETRLGGATTVLNYTPLAYTLPASNLGAAGRDRFAEA
jgi:hypothetical protein